MTRKLIFGLLMLALGSSGCGTLFGIVGGPNGNRTEHLLVPVETVPPGAEIFEKAGDKYIAHGTSPTTVSAAYTAKDGYTPGFLAGFTIGTLLDLGLGYYSLKAYEDAKNDSKSTTLPLTGVVLVSAALLVDLIVLAGESEKASSTELTLVARATGFGEATHTLSVPGPEVGGLHLALSAPVVALTEGQMRAKAVVKRDLGKVLVYNVSPGRSVAADLGRVATSLTAAEMQLYSKAPVVGKADVDAMLSVEKAKDTLGCNDTACMAEIGGMLGTDLVLVGDIDAAGSYLVISYRILNTRQASVVARVSHRITVEGSDARASENALVNGIADAIRELVESIN